MFQCMDFNMDFGVWTCSESVCVHTHTAQTAHPLHSLSHWALCFPDLFSAQSAVHQRFTIQFLGSLSVSVWRRWHSLTALKTATGKKADHATILLIHRALRCLVGAQGSLHCTLWDQEAQVQLRLQVYPLAEICWWRVSCHTYLPRTKSHQKEELFATGTSFSTCRKFEWYHGNYESHSHAGSFCERKAISGGRIVWTCKIRRYFSWEWKLNNWASEIVFLQKLCIANWNLWRETQDTRSSTKIRSSKLHI